MTDLLEVDGLVKHFPARGRGVVHAVDGVSLSVAAGETLGVVGESGSGKSTVAKLILRLLEPTAGAIRLDGADIAHASRRELRAIRRRVQIVFQDPYSSLDPRMTARAIVAEPLRVAGRSKDIDRRVPEVLALVGLGPRARVRASRTSCRAGSGNASASPARSWSSPSSWCSTSRSARSTARSRRRSSTSWSTCRRASVSPTCSSPTTSPSCGTSPTGSR